jgi:predicted transcriptional regulator
MGKNVELDLERTEELYNVAKALASEVRLEILKLLNFNSFNVNEIAEKLNIPTSTAALHVKVLEDAGLIHTELQPGVRGSMKVCSRKSDNINIQLDTLKLHSEDNSFYMNMPIGNFVDCLVYPTCGLVNENGFIDSEDKPRLFYNPRRVTAQLLWFHKGYVEYRFPNNILQVGKEKLIEVSLELCSEAPNYRNNWPSDITMWINGVDVGSWTSPGDFGGRRGRLNPTWWSEACTQYGLLKTWRVTKDGTFIDENKISDTKIAALNLSKGDYITVRIGIKEDAKNLGGVNIFGEKFGDYEQNIVMRIDYSM